MIEELIAISREQFKEFGLKSYTVELDKYRMTIAGQWKGINNFSISPQFYKQDNFYDHDPQWKEIAKFEAKNKDEEELKRKFYAEAKVNLVGFQTEYVKFIKII